MYIYYVITFIISALSQVYTFYDLNYLFHQVFGLLLPYRIIIFSFFFLLIHAHKIQKWTFPTQRVIPCSPVSKMTTNLLTGLCGQNIFTQYRCSLISGKVFLDSTASRGPEELRSLGKYPPPGTLISPLTSQGTPVQLLYIDKQM